MFRKNTLHYKLNIFAISLISFTIITGCAVAIYSFEQVIKKNYTENIKKVSKNFNEITIEANKQRLDSYMEFISKNGLLVKLLDKKDDQAVETVRSSINFNEVNFIIIKNNKSEVTYLGDSSDDINELIARNPVTGDSESFWVDGNKKIGLYILETKIVKDSDGNNIGSIIAGFKIPADKYTLYIKEVFKMDATIFAGDVRISTTIVKDNKQQVGTTLDSNIADSVLKKGKGYTGDTDIFSTPYVTSYTPIMGPSKTPVGALVVGDSIDNLNKENLKVVISISILGAILFILSIFIANKWLNRKFIKPLEQLSSTMRIVSEGNYNTRIPDNLRNYDEIQNLYKSLGKMTREILFNHEKVKLIAYYDSLTGLENRALLIERYGADNNNTNKNKENIEFLMYLNIDKFKIVNDLLGHRIGDLLIIAISKRLVKIVNNYSCYEVFRLSGDEFVICRKTEFTINELHEFAKEVLDAFREPFFIENNKLDVTISIGIAYCIRANGGYCIGCGDKCEKNIFKLLKDAEIALYQVKSEGKNNYKIFDSEMYESIKSKAEIENELKGALERNELILYYQPQYNVLTDEFKGFEALIRWEKPGKGIISPLAFIPIAEETGLIVEIGEWVLRTACKLVKAINEQYNKEYIVSVNVSVAQLLNDNYEQSVLSVLEEVGLNPRFLELEITESILMRSLAIVNSKLKYLQEQGISIALDDFGTGYSSLTYLRKLPINILKVDKAFVDDICINDRSIIGDIVKIGHNMDLKVVAEGVEVKEQLEFLKQFNCDIIQGYYFSKPLSESDLIEKLNLNKETL
ncbi:MAG: EAL domain-containing protein [Clostridiaceae bacterium]